MADPPGPAILRSRQQIPINEWAMVMADRKGRDGMLIVNNEDPVNGKYCVRGKFCPLCQMHLLSCVFFVCLIILL